MKIQTQIFLLTLSNGEKAVPPKDPLVRLEQLKSHSTKLMADFFSSCQGSERWERRLHAVLNRAGEIYGKKCSFFDPNVPNGGPRPTLEYRKRRDIEDSDLRYSSTDGESSIKGITTGLRKFAERYLAECPGQRKEQHLAKKAQRWREKLLEKYQNGC